MKVGIDLDGTLADIHTPWLDRVNRHIDANYSLKDWTDWGASFLHKHGITDSLSFLSPDIYDIAKPIPGAAEGIKRLMNIEGIELVCVSANPFKNDEDYKVAKKEWLSKHVPELAEGVQFARVKRGLGLNVLIDDGPEHFENPDFTGVLVVRPWNHYVNTEHKLHDWDNAHEIVQTIHAKWKAGETVEEALPLPGKTTGFSSGELGKGALQSKFGR
jgi:5'(3')-deoxyribonucleotidase